MQKIAVILHGWPQGDIGNHFLTKFLINKDYKVIAPNMFSLGSMFSSENISKYLIKELNGKYPNLIIGMSLGGLVIPHLAKKYKKAKLIFIASSARFETKFMPLRIALKLIQNKLFFNYVSFLINLPDSIFTKIYTFFNPFKGDEKERETYNDDTLRNIKAIKNISMEKEQELLNFILIQNNKSVLKTLTNKSLIINGKEDMLMTSDGGTELYGLLRNSKLVVNNGSHFNVLEKLDLSTIEDFINR